MRNADFYLRERNMEYAGSGVFKRGKKVLNRLHESRAGMNFQQN